MNESPQHREALRRARRLAWLSLAYMGTVVLAMGLTMGGSKSMRAALVEDLLSFVPPIAFLVTSRLAAKRPNAEFPYGYHRASDIGFLCSSLALAAFGVVLLVDNSIALLRAEHPTIGAVTVFGHVIWRGWLMIAALVYSVLPLMVLGWKKLPLARQLNDKGLHTDADMNKADWYTGIAGAFGVLGVSFGWWWADALGAIIISLDITWDGLRDLKEAVVDLMDHAPTTVDHEDPDPVVGCVRTELDVTDWIAAHDVRLREQGQRIAGEIRVVPIDELALVRRIDELATRLRRMDERLQDVAIMPVHELEPR